MAEETKKPRRKNAKKIVGEYFEALARQDVDGAAAMWRDGSIDRLHGIAELRAPADVRAYFSELFGAFPDWQFEVLELAASGELVAVRWRTRASFTGPGRFQGIAPNGAKVELEGCDMLRVLDGEIVENNAYTNGMQIAEQLGLLPAQDSPAGKAMTAAFNARTSAVAGLRRLRDRNS